MGKRRWKHPTSRGRHPLYSAWKNMIYRCTDVKRNRWQYYGGRGVTVCDRWLNDYDAFCDDVGPHPGKGMSLDRYPNKDGNYEPGNVRWATAAQQNRNSHRAKLTADMITAAKAMRRIGYTYQSIADMMGVNVTSAHRAINELTWTKD